ncbi:MAG TPA: hypothetical protein VK475_10840 [Pyrinomonadaceae bacterium]|nr:hypothetical protein [Pyrinomonadaceae bacterium]
MTDFFTRVAGRAIGTAPAIQPVVVSRYAPAHLPNTAASGLEAESGFTEPRLKHNGLNLSKTGQRINKTDPGADSREVERLGKSSTEPLASDTGTSFGQTLIDGTVPPSNKVSSIHPKLSEFQERPPTASPAAGDPSGNEELTLDGRMTTEPQSGRAFDSFSTSRRTATNATQAETPSFAKPATSLPFVESSIEIGRDPQSSFKSDKGTRTGITELQQESRSQDDADRTWMAASETSGLMSPVAHQEPVDHDESFPVIFNPPGGERSFALPEERVESNSPVVRVTIGRIDVRAVTPATEPTLPSSAPAPPKLSLDEFLRLHNGRRP